MLDKVTQNWRSRRGRRRNAHIRQHLLQTLDKRMLKDIGLYRETDDRSNPRWPSA